MVITCLAAIISMVSFAIWPVFLVNLGGEWNLSNVEIGWVGGAYFIGYVCLLYTSPSPRDEL